MGEDEAMLESVQLMEVEIKEKKAHISDVDMLNSKKALG